MIQDHLTMNVTQAPNVLGNFTVQVKVSGLSSNVLYFVFKPSPKVTSVVVLTTIGWKGINADQTEYALIVPSGKVFSGLASSSTSSFESLSPVWNFDPNQKGSPAYGASLEDTQYTQIPNTGIQSLALSQYLNPIQDSTPFCGIQFLIEGGESRNVSYCDNSTAISSTFQTLDSSKIIIGTIGSSGGSGQYVNSFSLILDDPSSRFSTKGDELAVVRGSGFGTLLTKLHVELDNTPLQVNWFGDDFQALHFRTPSGVGRNLILSITADDMSSNYTFSYANPRVEIVRLVSGNTIEIVGSNFGNDLRGKSSNLL
eukprot:TRINITY_DN1172_c0_g1_i9.p1 TRINITY_DN1172_c0_g1~~TRINITY_DN1172_c0_g1_i9.p1  ORF type:complete len:313 (-),score=68.40 TRINITY_DN1172_c0_g1_i9:320-1258(-)